MRILSVTVRNYRVHRELTVNFKGPLTLIGGPNESGKSTLVEALHRAFFLRARTTGETQKSMISTCWNGAPEVTVQFEAAGTEYALTKRFSGATGTTRLAKAAGGNWAGEEAEAEIAALLKVESIGKGRGLSERVSQQWLHLWAWQGDGVRNPTEYATEQKDDLVKRLQDSGGGVLQSALDARISQQFAQESAAIFTQAGNPKAGSELEKAEEELAQAVENDRRAAERLNKLQEEANNFEQAAQDIARLTHELRGLDEQKAALQAKLTEVEQLRGVESDQARDLTTAESKHSTLKQHESAIGNARQSLATLRAALEPKSEQVKSLTASSEAAHKSATEAGRRLDEAAEKTRLCRVRRDLASACVRRDEREAALKELLARESQVLSQSTLLERLNTELASVPDVTIAKLGKLEGLETELRGCEAGLRAMAAGIEITAGTVTVRMGDQVLSPGELHVITENTELTIGEQCRLKISPGGGTALQDARAKVQQLRSELQNQLDAIGLRSVAAARDAVARRKELLGDIRKAKGSLETLKADELPNDLAKAKADAAAATAEMERRAGQLPGTVIPDEPDRAFWLTSEDRALDVAEREEKEAKHLRDTAAQALKSADAELQAYRTEVNEQERAMERVSAQIELLVTTHGQDAARALALSEAAQADQFAAAALNGTRAKLTALQPDLLKTDHVRLNRALEQTADAKRDAEKRRFLAEAALRLDGSENPQEARALAAARLRSVEKLHAGARRKAEAIRLLDRLYREQQQALADEFTQPLAERISAYLRCLFGPGARAVMTFSPDGFTELKLIRPTEGLGGGDFDTLSGGAKEQVAAAVRLALAEILAPAHDNCLPVVLDDAFAYSDPDRVQILQRMLDLAASRGLQLIILTCNPSDYAALGAQQITLRPELPQTAPASSPSNGAAQQGPTAPQNEEPGADLPSGQDELEASVPHSALVTREQRDQFVACLAQVGGKASNAALRERLGWGEDAYRTVKEDLVAAGQVLRGKGHGGSVILP